MIVYAERVPVDVVAAERLIAGIPGAPVTVSSIG
jgi:hypothetical protein